MNSEKLAAHLRVDRYGDFQLTAAIRPALHVPVVPREGYRRDTYRDAAAKLQVPVIAAAVSREKLFDVFLELLQLALAQPNFLCGCQSDSGRTTACASNRVTRAEKNSPHRRQHVPDVRNRPQRTLECSSACALFI